MKFKHFLLPALALMACGALEAQTSDSRSSPSPGDGDHGHWRRHHHAWIWSKLNLTDAQKQQIKSFR